MDTGHHVPTTIDSGVPSRNWTWNSHVANRAPSKHWPMWDCASDGGSSCSRTSGERWGESALGAPTNRRGPSDVRGTQMGADLLFQELGDPATSNKLLRGLPLWGTSHGGAAMRQPVGDCFQRGCMNNRRSRMCRARRGLGWHGRRFPARADGLFEKPASHGCLYAMTKKQGSKQRNEYRASTW